MTNLLRLLNLYGNSIAITQSNVIGLQPNMNTRLNVKLLLISYLVGEGCSERGFFFSQRRDKQPVLSLSGGVLTYISRCYPVVPRV